MWARHEGKHLPAAWGGPQQGTWGRWEPQFPDTNKPNTSLFGHSSVYIQIDLESKHFRDRATKKILQTLREMKHDFEEIRRTARRDEYFSENFETVLTSRLIKKQDDLLDRIIQSHTT
jgi:type I restriction-modification system DNA methylase subunit